jgi:hypothetical protein
MGSRQYIVPADLMTISDMKDYRVGALAAGIQRGFQKAIGTPQPGWEGLSIPATKARIVAGDWPSQIDSFEFQNILHAGAALDQWNTAALAAVGTQYSIFQAIAAPAANLRMNKIAVFYGVSIETVPNPVSRITFRKNTATGITMAEFDVETLGVMERVMGFFSEPVVIDNNVAFAAQVTARIATGVLARVQLLSFIFEPAGTTHQ